MAEVCKNAMANSSDTISNILSVCFLARFARGMQILLRSWPSLLWPSVWTAQLVNKGTERKWAALHGASASCVHGVTATCRSVNTGCMCTTQTKQGPINRKTGSLVWLEVKNLWSCFALGAGWFKQEMYSRMEVPLYSSDTRGNYRHWLWIQMVWKLLSYECHQTRVSTAVCSGNQTVSWGNDTTVW